MPPLRALIACALVAMLGLACAAMPADAKTRHVRKLHLTTHVDPGRVQAKKGARTRPRARTSTFATTWPCTAQSADRAPLLSNAPQVKVIYAYPQGQPPNSADYGVMQADAAAVRDHVAADSNNTKTVRFDVGAAGPSCDANSSNLLDIETVQLAHDSAYYAGAADTFKTLVTELQGKLTAATPHQRVNYLVYLDNVHPASATVAGQGDLPQDTTHGYDNAANQGRTGDGGLFALIYGQGTATGFGVSNDSRRHTFLHEMSHTLGAVQNSAPHSSLGGHCYDVDDIMCYEDGGDYFTNGGSLVQTCASTTFTDLPLDCGKDDYFNSSPANGSFLATSWNEYDSVYLCPISDCDSDLSASEPTVSLTSKHVGGQLTLAASASNGPIEHFEWDTDGDGIYETDTGNSPTVQPQFSKSASTLVQVRAVKANGTFGYASLRITPTDPIPRLQATGNLTVGGQVTLDGTATSDPDGLIQNYKWDTDGDGTYETDSGLAQTVTTSYASTGMKTAGLEVEYSYGWSATAIQFSIGLPAGTGPDGKPLPGLLPGLTITAPSISASTVKIAKLISSGLRVRISCGNPCVASLRLVVDGKAAKKLHLGKKPRAVTIGRTQGQFAPGIARPVIKLTGPAKAALRHAKKVTISIKGSIVQAPLAPLSVNKALTFKR